MSSVFSLSNAYGDRAFMFCIYPGNNVRIVFLNWACKGRIGVLVGITIRTCVRGNQRADHSSPRHWRNNTKNLTDTLTKYIIALTKKIYLSLGMRRKFSSFLNVSLLFCFDSSPITSETNTSYQCHFLLMGEITLRADQYFGITVTSISTMHLIWFSHQYVENLFPNTITDTIWFYEFKTEDKKGPSLPDVCVLGCLWHLL